VVLDSQRKVTHLTENKETSAIDSLLKEQRVFNPPKEIIEQSNIKKWMEAHGITSYEELLAKAKNIEWFWSEAAKEVVEWYEPYQEVLEWNEPFSKWFVGAKYNIVHDALDKHIKTHRKNKVAIIFEGEPGDVRKLTFYDLYLEVNKLTNALKKLGIQKGDRVSIYLPMIPELPIAMLACAKIGAIHTVVFSGFSVGGLQQRINDSECKAVITCDGFYRRGDVVPLKEQVDEAVNKCPTVQTVIVYKRTGKEVPWTEGRDRWWHELTQHEPAECETEKLDSEHMLYILYTSGTTGQPKGVMSAHGGYAVGTGITLKFVFDIKDTDIYWCTADIGWVTGHSYIVYAPLILGATSIMYEGAPDWPEPDRWWQIVEKYGVTIFYTAPTAIRMHMRSGEKWANKHDLSSLRLLGTVGETINPEAWMWYHLHIGKQKCPIMDTWWQTETGSFVISPVPLTTLKPGTPTKPLPGFSAAVFDESGKRIQGGGGDLYLLSPWPAMLRGLYKNPDRYKQVYWSKLPHQYLTGDKAREDEDGYIWVQGRADDILKVAGHRIGNYEIESALVSHPQVSEAVVIGKPHPIKGESIVAFVVLKEGFSPSEELRAQLREHVGNQMGKIARPDEVWFVKDVPKTRSGKIMRRVVRARLLGEPLGDLTTLRNPEAVDEIGYAT
jgi:acetyl-CoA synthetase